MQQNTFVAQALPMASHVWSETSNTPRRLHETAHPLPAPELSKHASPARNSTTLEAHAKQSARMRRAADKQSHAEDEGWRPARSPVNPTDSAGLARLRALQRPQNKRGSKWAGVHEERASCAQTCNTTHRKCGAHVCVCVCALQIRNNRFL